MKLAIVHDWLTGMRGGEKALEAIGDLYPQADLFTLLHVPGSVSAGIERHRITTSFLQHMPGAARFYRHYLPAFPAAVEQFDFTGYDMVVSVSHCAVKSIVHSPATRHLCYCLTPMRYAWDQFDAYFGAARTGRLGEALLRPVLASLARWDRTTAHRVDQFVAISHYVAARIARYYNCRASVVYPPVGTEFFSPDGSEPGRCALVVSALVPYKRVDLAIEACARAGVPLRIVGDGPELARLKRLSGAQVTFGGWVSDADIRTAYRQAGVVLLPGVEDFGIVPLEAQACGRPVVAVGQGGAMETVVDGVSGLLVADGTAAAFGDAVRQALETRLPSGPIRAHAEQFGRERFAREMRNAIEQAAGPY
jgi:glycosyltransferase involved in cell wall biosynthesis